MACHLTILASGSGGNCTYLETDSTRILIDAGLSVKQMEERLATVGRKLADVHAVLITHEHRDHIEGLSLLARRFEIPIYTNHETRAAILENWQGPRKKGGSNGADEETSSNGDSKHASVKWKIFENGHRFSVGDFDVEPFSVLHDAADPVGFLFLHGGRRIAFLTDVGQMTHLTLQKMREVDVLVLESNHDLDLLQKNRERPESLKQRIRGKHGHLSNKDAAAAISQVISKRLCHVFLAHLSEDCNCPKIAETSMRKILQDMGASHVQVTVTSQDRPCQTFDLEPARPLSAETPSLFGQPESR
jgi:phosphoribosyl 1,2-cyclic phosphodiesterase